MAFSLRKMFSNISYFSKSGDHENQDFLADDQNHYSNLQCEIDFPAMEPDSTSNHTRSVLPETVNFTVKKGSLSDTNLFKDVSTKKRNKNKYLKLDIKRASQSLSENLSYTDTAIENTPKHILLDCRSAELFSEKFKKLDFSKSFEYVESDVDIESLSECSDSESGKDEGKSEFKMCRKVESKCEELLEPASTPESFGDTDLEQYEEDRTTLLLNYQEKFEKIDNVLKNLLTEFQFHTEVSKIFNSKTVSLLPNPQSHLTDQNTTNSWNITEKEDDTTKLKFRQQLQSMKNSLDHFMNNYLQDSETKTADKKIFKRSITFDLHKGKRIHKLKISNKKRIKLYDFPDLRDSLLNLFEINRDSDENTQLINNCQCQCHEPCLDQSDSGLTSKADNLSNQSITSSIGNFSLDSSTLSAYSESLDLIVSYNSFQDTSLFSSLLQKPAVERITFYVQVHNIQVKSEFAENYESKTSILFYCPACNVTENEENGLLKHILGQKHCEKIHFLYKTAYIKKCMASGKEIQPSTVLNPMTMYRDDNKIVCFGDAMYACSLCLENLIVGESILMAHCSEPNHLDHKEKLFEMFE